MIKKSPLCAIYILLVMGLCLAMKAPSVSKEKPIPNKATEIHPLLPGAEIPSVPITTIDGKSITLKTLFNNKPGVLLFYRGGWCPFCNRQLGQLQKIIPDLKSMGVPLIAISPDRPVELKKSTDSLQLEYQLVSDSAMQVAIAFGLAFKVEEDLVKKYMSWNLDIESASGMKHHLLPVPAVFVVNGSGQITFSYVNPNYKVRLDPSVLLAAVNAELKN